MTNIEQARKELKEKHEKQLIELEREFIIREMFIGIDIRLAVFDTFLSISKVKNIDTLFRLLNKLKPEPLYIHPKGVAKGYGSSNKREGNYTDKTPLEPCYPYMITLSSSSTKVKFYTYIGDELLHIWIEFPSVLRIDHRKTQHGHGCNCYWRTTYCEPVNDEPLSGMKKQKWGSVEAYANDFSWHIQEPPSGKDVDTIKNVIDFIYKIQ